MFRLHKALFAQILDSFQFRVSVPGAQTVVREFSIRYVVHSSTCSFNTKYLIILFDQRHLFVLHMSSIIFFFLKKKNSKVTVGFAHKRYIAIQVGQLLSHRYEPEEGEVTFINNGLTDVLEGGSKVIKRDELYMETATFKEFRYTIISGPQHGVLHLIDPTSGQMEEVGE